MSRRDVGSTGLFLILAAGFEADKIQHAQDSLISSFGADVGAVFVTVRSVARHVRDMSGDRLAVGALRAHLGLHHAVLKPAMRRRSAVTLCGSRKIACGRSTGRPHPPIPAIGHPIPYDIKAKAASSPHDTGAVLSGY